MKTSTLLIPALLALALTSACEKKCTVPAGEYAMTMEPIAGDCPPEVLDTFEAYSDTVTVDPGTQCARFLTSIDGETEGGCAILMEISAQSVAEGLKDGQSVLTLKCEEKFQCKHEFDVVFEMTNAGSRSSE